MSDGKKYPYEEAYAIATSVLEELRPHCVRAEIAGSIRRKKALVGDIEIVAIPKPYGIGMFEDGLAAIVNKWEKVKGDMEYGKTGYTQRILPGGIKLDLFFAEEGNWGNIFAIRTGSAEYSHKVLAATWSSQGWHGEGGYLFRGEEKYGAKEEKELFEKISLKYVEPEERI